MVQHKITWLIIITALAGWGVSETARAPAPVPVPVPVHYPEQLPGPYTGGFGEQTCHSCHFDYPLNYEEGSMKITGLSNTYRPGKTYTLTLQLERENLAGAGFQLAARFRDSAQAGSFEFDPERVRYTELQSSVRYLQHGPAGTEPSGRHRTAWNIRWKAPFSSPGPVVFHLAANAANGDASEFGDFIYVDTLVVYPVK